MKTLATIVTLGLLAGSVSAQNIHHNTDENIKKDDRN